MGSPPAQLSLVAFYRSKPSQLEDLIRQCQDIASDRLGICFTPYEVAQVHATITGMERVPLPGIDDIYLSRNAHVLYDRRQEMNYDSLRPTVENLLPVSIRWGGYNPNEIPYTGKSAQPFRRSIYFNRSTGKLVLIGWPHINGDFSEPKLLQLRNGLERECGLVHKYQNDNDFFQVLGTFDLSKVQGVDGEIYQAEAQLADLLEETRIDVELTPEELQVVCYLDTALPAATTHSIALNSDELSTALIKRLYGKHR
ncbi:MAG: hypothetical protein HKN13_00735 [Rhodothermales bacterium]|nr:hypothetical protein [Rhodothermales bacterium]